MTETRVNSPSLNQNNNNMKKSFTHPALTDDDDNQIYLDVPKKMIVCPSCGGHGTHERRDIDMSAVVDSMHEDGDQDGLDHYRSGGFDTTCEECGGLRVIHEFDFEYLESNYPNEWEQICSYNQSAYEDAKYAAAERRACGG